MSSAPARGVGEDALRGGVTRSFLLPLARPSSLATSIGRSPFESTRARGGGTRIYLYLWCACGERASERERSLFGRCRCFVWGAVWGRSAQGGGARTSLCVCESMEVGAACLSCVYAGLARGVWVWVLMAAAGGVGVFAPPARARGGCGPGARRGEARAADERQPAHRQDMCGFWGCGYSPRDGRCAFRGADNAAAGGGGYSKFDVACKVVLLVSLVITLHYIII